MMEAHESQVKRDLEGASGAVDLALHVRVLHLACELGQKVVGQREPDAAGGDLADNRGVLRLGPAEQGGHHHRGVEDDQGTGQFLGLMGALTGAAFFAPGAHPFGIRILVLRYD